MIDIITFPNIIITKKLITQDLFVQVLGSLHNHSIYKEDSLPVHNILDNSEYLLFCNKLSEIYGLQPVYEAWKNETGMFYDKNTSANGIRLLTSSEWFQYKDHFEVQSDYSERVEDDLIGNPLLLTGFRVCQSK
jgi:hypothetical protein